ncbi:regulating synaptic membrane exocytosis protein 3-like, partial [Malurus melanocephalus]|uniref:regulating synaptic membrane exocytosis protein 3-like n=1 Tax=Malurus melanocephalus TaxID=175006 RepID=UPI0025483AC7
MFDGDAGSSSARSVVRSSSISGEMFGLEKSARGSADSVAVTASKKRRSSLGAKMVAIVGLSQWSKSTLQLNQTALGVALTVSHPCAGDVHVGVADRNGQLEVDVIQARGLIPKMGSKCIPATYVKVYVLEAGVCLAKKRTKAVKRTSEPSF